MATQIARMGFWRSTLVLIPQALLALLGALLARHNLKVGRGDLRGAFSLSFVYFMTSLLVDILQNKSVVTDIKVFVSQVGVDTYLSLLTWTFYIAIEPWVRKYWPQTIITWSRLLAGRWRDPLVARDVLVGLLFGLTLCLVWGPLGTLASTAVDTSPPQFFPTANLNGFGAAVAWFFNWLRNGLLVAQGVLLLLCLLRVLLRKQWLASMAFVSLWELAALTGNERSLVIAAVMMLIMSGGMVLLLTRFGLLAPTAAFVGVALFEAFFTTDFGSWYGQSSLFAIIVVGGLALLAFRLSLGHQPLSASLMRM
jgi:serine/threonine-protein kinase